MTKFVERGAFQEYMIYCLINSEASWKWSEERVVMSGWGGLNEGKRGWCEPKCRACRGPELVTQDVPQW